MMAIDADRLCVDLMERWDIADKQKEELVKQVMADIVTPIVVSQPTIEPEIIRCKECRHRIVNNHYGERGYLKIKGYCELDTGDPFELGRDAGNDDWFCADAERGEPQHGSD